MQNEEDDEQDEINRVYGKNILKYIGKMLTAVFKDYLIYDDIYEFLEPSIYTRDQSRRNIMTYAKNCAEMAHKKYAFKNHSFSRNHENFTNRPNYMLLSAPLSKMISRNLKTKYQQKYQKRVAGK